MTLPCASDTCFCGGQRSFFAEVDEGGVAVVGAQQQEAAAAEVAGDGMHDGEGEAGGDGGVDGVAAFAAESAVQHQRRGDGR